jgi:hypothetical protein
MKRIRRTATVCSISKIHPAALCAIFKPFLDALFPTSHLNHQLQKTPCTGPLPLPLDRRLQIIRLPPPMQSIQAQSCIPTVSSTGKRSDQLLNSLRSEGNTCLKENNVSNYGSGIALFLFQSSSFGLSQSLIIMTDINPKSPLPPNKKLRGR